MILGTIYYVLSTINPITRASHRKEIIVTGSSGIVHFDSSRTNFHRKVFCHGTYDLKYHIFVPPKRSWSPSRDCGELQMILKQLLSSIHSW